MHTATLAAPIEQTEKATLVALLLAQLILFLIPLIVLGQAIGWPASLRLAPEEALPLIHREALSLQIGYWGYLLTSVALIPLAVALRRYANANGVAGLLVDATLYIGVAAGVLKTLGIVRWLIAMPALASLHETTADPVVRSAVEVSYLALNGYAGSVGELLGVQLFSGLWLLGTGLVLGRIGFRAISIAGMLIGVGFLLNAMRTIVPGLEQLQAYVIPIALLWFPAVAFAIWRKN